VYYLRSEPSGDEIEVLGDAPDPVADRRSRQVSKRKNHKKKGKGK
jgi:hypothetical protein